MKTTHRGFIVPLLLIVIALLLAGGGAYVYTQTKQANSPAAGNASAATSTTQATNSQIADWKTYTNTKYGFAFKYPADWTVNDASYTYKDKAYLAVSFASPLIIGVPGASREAYFYTQITYQNGSWQHKEGMNLSLLHSDGGAVPVDVSQQYLESRPEFKTAGLIFSSLKAN